jgi:dolichyl-diphosphooligosaccharide--protein glycosyltransferase
MRRDLILAALIAAAAFAVRSYPAWNNVFTPQGVNFLETDAWYHVRLIESQARNFPWRVTLDPYASPDGQYVPIAPLFDTLAATIVVLVHGRAATTDEVERIAAFVPPLLGALTTLAIWGFARRLFDRRAGLIAAALLVVLPGHFMDRTMLGFVDHHALEALLAVATMWALVRGAEEVSTATAVAAGVLLGLYLLTWGSGAFFVAILAAWLVAFAALARTSNERHLAARASGIAVLAALALVLAFQDSRMHRYGSQIVALAGLAGVAIALAIATWPDKSRRVKYTLLGGLATVAIGGGVALIALAGPLLSGIAIDIARLAPDPARMNVLEARPLFLYAGEWRWSQPWAFFRTGFFIGLAAILPFAVRVGKRRRPGDVMVLVFALATFVATIGQNRFGYYLVTACAILGGWLATWLLDWGGVPHRDNPTPATRARVPLARELAVIAVSAGMFAPNLSPSLLLAERATGFSAYWREAMTWLRIETPPPFQSHRLGDDYFLSRYSSERLPAPDYTVMNWWDQGYWIVQRARRVPVSNPTQERAPLAARFYAETDEARALAMLQADRARYVLSDWELPFRSLPDGTIMGRFQSVVDWAGAPHGKYYEILYQREGRGWAPLWVFYEPYYQTMAFRLAVLGGRAAEPSNSTTIVSVVDRVDANGLRFREAVTVDTYDSFDSAMQAAPINIGVETIVVGLNPWATAFPVPALQSMSEVHAARAAGQLPAEAPMVRIFEVK